MKLVLQNLFARSKHLFVFAFAMLFMAFGASAQTEAHAIIDAVEAAFDLIVPVCVAIVSFFVVIRLAKRVVS